MEVDMHQAYSKYLSLKSDKLLFKFYLIRTPGDISFDE
jgi:hypothetical protein